jgi:hypothetical protein
MKQKAEQTAKDIKAAAIAAAKAKEEMDKKIAAAAKKLRAQLFVSLGSSF